NPRRTWMAGPCSPMPVSQRATTTARGARWRKRCACWIGWTSSTMERTRYRRSSSRTTCRESRRVLSRCFSIVSQPNHDETARRISTRPLELQRHRGGPEIDLDPGDHLWRRQGVQVVISGHAVQHDLEQAPTPDVDRYMRGALLHGDAPETLEKSAHPGGVALLDLLLRDELFLSGLSARVELGRLPRDVRRGDPHGAECRRRSLKQERQPERVRVGHLHVRERGLETHPVDEQVVGTRRNVHHAKSAVRAC